MNIKKYKDVIEQVLKKDDRLWNKDKTEFNKALLFNLIDEIDETIISLLLEEDATREKFFVKIKDAYVFKTKEFKFFIDEHKVFNSYTSYANRIGLSDGKEFIMDRNDVVLNFPFKDCILKGGQSNEEGIDTYFEYDKKVTKTQEKQGLKSGNYNEKQSKREEIFYNEILAEDEIDRLFDKKALVNWKKFNKDGEEKDFNFDGNDNLIIKGNNLIALSSLIPKYESKVKSIIIDPPYYFWRNKSDDSFNYNSNFKLSTWLTFMKNRIELSKQLLADDGIISIIIGIDGYEHLKLICDEIFNINKEPKRYIGTITWRKTDNQSNIGDFANVIDYILLYRKEPSTKLNRLPLTEKAKKEYSYEDSIGKYRRSNLLDLTRGKHYFDIKTPDGNLIKGPWMVTETEYIDLLKNDGIHWPSSGMQIPYGKIYLKNAIENGQIASDFWDNTYGTNQRSADEIKKLFDGRVFDYAKPEKLVMNLISLTSNKNDIVLDFFLGSGTTTAVAQKMNRQYIGIEQMDYVNDITIERMQKVLCGEQGGISELVEWQGGGAFVYCELAKWNEKAKEEINSCNNLDEIKSLFTDLCDKYYLDYNLKVKEFKNKTIVEDEFIKLPLEEQKYMFLTMLDLNQLYVQATEMEDSKFDISEEDQSLTRMFYEEG